MVGLVVASLTGQLWELDEWVSRVQRSEVPSSGYEDIRELALKAKRADIRRRLVHMRGCVKMFLT